MKFNLNATRHDLITFAAHWGATIYRHLIDVMIQRFVIIYIEGRIVTANEATVKVDFYFDRCVAYEPISDK